MNCEVIVDTKGLFSWLSAHGVYVFDASMWAPTSPCRSLCVLCETHVKGNIT